MNTYRSCSRGGLAFPRDTVCTSGVADVLAEYSENIKYTLTASDAFRGLMLDLPFQLFENPLITCLMTPMSISRFSSVNPSSISAIRCA